MSRWSTVWMMVGIVSLLVVGCTSRPGRTISGAPTWSPTPTATRMPSPTLTPEVTVVMPSTEEGQTVRFTVVYDNNEYAPTLRATWGFACWVEAGEATVLFDTGGDGPTLLGNMAKLSLDPLAIDAIVLSHIHGDHTGGLAGLLETGTRPTVCVPAAFPASFKADVRARADLVEVTEPVEILPGVYTTGQMGSRTVEQALVVEAGAGWVVLTGCAHPGIVEMVHQAKEVAAGEVALAMGGFHLGGASRDQIEGIIAEFRRLGVRRVAPCHCTGDRARQIFAHAYGADCTLAGVGWVVSVGSGG
ncbi:MAG: MBL fold metallo-hydrolase [Anaerolineae bacterium]|nr:MBL fold metallo-hydrolase [Anaerolineae bacterium]